MKRRRWIGLTMAAMVAGSAVAYLAHAQDEEAARLEAALAAPDRPADNKARDATRRPLEVIEFLGIESGMTVLDVIAAGGWYTEVLSAAVGPSGTVISQNPDFFVNREGFAEAEQALVERLGNVEPVHGEIADADIDGRVDAAISALNFHDIYHMGGEAAALELLESIYDALEPGGVFGLIDHRGIAGQDNAEFHRIEASTARDLLVDAGFNVEAESNLLANPADDHMRSVRDEVLQRNTDRFLLRARKPG
jgi:predicted methyltransferase